MATLAVPRSSDGRPPPNLDLVVRGLAGLCIVIGVLVLVGWVGPWTVLTSFVPGGVASRFNTACGLVLAGIAVWLMGRDPVGLSPVPSVLGVLVAVLGLVTLGEYVLHRDLALDQLLQLQTRPTDTPMALGRMTLGSALGLVLAGAAIVLRRLHPPAASAAELGVLVLGSLVAIEYILGIDYIHGPAWRSSAMALPTSLGLLTLGGSLVLLQPRRGFAGLLAGHGPGATLARRMAPVALLVPVGVAWLARTDPEAPLYSRHESLSFGVVAGMAMLLAATHWTSVWLQRTELSRQRARERLARRERQLEEALHRERDARRRADFEAATHRTLRRLATSFSLHREQEALVQHIVDEATALVDATMGTLVADAPSETGAMVRLRASSGLHVAARVIEPRVTTSVARPDPSPSAEPASSRLPAFEASAVVHVADTREHPDAKGWLPVPAGQPPARSVLGAPVITRAGTMLGNLFVGHAEPNHFGEEDAALLEKIAELAATALETAQLMAALRRSEAQAHAAAHHKDQFLAMLGHELRNPLAPIATALEVLQAQPQSGPEPMWAIIHRQMRHLTRLVDDLLDISRIGRGTLEVTPHPTAMADVVTLGVEMVSGLVDKRRHTLSLDVPRDGPSTIVVDEHRIAQVVANLLSNAAKYTEPGGHLHVSARRSDDAVTLVVRDDGPGIDDQTLATLFGPFVQGPRTLDRADGGLGLGLSLARAIVELHGGSITGRRLRPRGSEFTVVLPQDRVVATETPADAPCHHDAALRVLVVDDNEDAAQMLKILIGSWGYDCSIAVHPSEALEQLGDEQRPDAAIVDIGLPDMSGYELVGHMRKALHDDALIVALTGYGQSRDQEQALAAGFDAHFTKPVSSEKLHTMLDDYARQRSRRAGA